MRSNPVMQHIAKNLMIEAAETIEQQKAEIERLRAALETIQFTTSNKETREIAASALNQQTVPEK